jgi:hypothetical protein
LKPKQRYESLAGKSRWHWASSAALAFAIEASET